MGMGEENVDRGAGPAIVAITVIVLIVLLAIVFYGLIGLHWFGFDVPAAVGASPSVTPSPSPSVSPSPS